MRAAARRVWTRLHRWLGLAQAVALGLSGLTGATLIVLKPLDRRLHPELFAAAAPGAAAASLDAVRESLVARHGAQASFTIRPPRRADDTLWARVSGPWHGTTYLDPGSARVLGERGEREGVVNWLFELHSALLLDEDGKPLLAVIALSYLLLLATGLVLWWPRNWRQAWRMRFDGGTTRSLFDLHRVAGSLLGLVIAASVASGAYMAWKPLARLVTAVSGDAAARPPVVAPAAGPRASLEAMTRTAQALFPRAGIGYVQFTAQASKPVRFRMKLADDPHPNGLTSVWFHPVTGAVLAVHRWDQLDAGSKGNSYLYPLHTGELGGAAHEALTALSGFSLFGLVVTGSWLWWRRRRGSVAPADAQLAPSCRQ